MSKVKHSLFLIILFCLSSFSFGQTQITTGVIQGTVVDPTGAVVSGATVEAKELKTNSTRTVNTQGDGRFVFLGLTPGNYKVKATKSGFATLVQENIELNVGQAVSLNFGMKISGTSEIVTVTGTPAVDVAKTESSTSLNARTVENIPVLGRKFEDLLTLTPGVSITQGPDGDEINFAGQRGIFNNVSLDGGDYNNGFFAEQLGGQRAAVDITLDAVQEFQVIANSASAEFGRTAGGVINVITKSGTNDLHGSLFHFQRLEALSSATSTGEPLTGFHREQFGGTVGGPIIKDKMFFFGAFEQIIGNLTRANLSAQQGTTACPVTAPVSPTNDALIAGNADCQRLTLVNFFQSRLGQAEGLPVTHPIRNSAALAKYDWNLNAANKLSASFNYDYSKNDQQTFDVPTYGDSANGTEGPSKIQAYNVNLFTTVSGQQLNEAHFSYNREDRPRAATQSKLPADTAMGFGPTFRFGNPFFLQPGVDETFWRTQLRDNYSIVSGKHSVKFGGDWLHSNNSQVFRGFFTGRYLFDSVTGFLHYANTSGAPGTGPSTVECANGTFSNLGAGVCPGSSVSGGPLLLYLQHAANSGPTTDAAGASAFNNENFALFIQDKWQIRRDFTLNLGLRWEAQIFPDPFVDPSKTAYASNLNNPLFPSNGTLPSDKKMIQPRIGFAWDIANKQKSVLRASWGIYNATQNMLTQVGALTTNGVQQQSIAAGTFFNTAGGPPPTWPNVIVPPAVPAGTFPAGTGVTVFDRNYRNPRIYATNVAFEQELAPNWAAYADFTWNKSVYLTRFVDANTTTGATSLPVNGDTVNYSGAAPFANLGSITNTQSSAKSLYRGLTVGMRKKYSHGFQAEANYVYSTDYDDDSNERDPFTFRYFNRFDFSKDYAPSDRDIRHKFNFYVSANKLPAGFEANLRMQIHSAQPITDNFTLVPTGAACSSTNSNTRVVNGVDCGRNHLRKDNAYSSVDWRLSRPFHFGDRYALVPTFEMFNTFNSANNVNSLASPALFNFDGFLRNGAGDPRQAQLAVRFTF
ncbi:MAG: enterobactin receptor protein [Candidatus Angelobacter sp.]|jgi:hypothetical protein|nr:enterobactin receptor protein [Candidatus Angelobacter sp.]